MAWFWRSDDAAAIDAHSLGLGDPIDSQSAAEGWLTSNYVELSTAGVRSVALFEEDRLVYGPMSLDPQ